MVLRKVLLWLLFLGSRAPIAGAVRASEDLNVSDEMTLNSATATGTQTGKDRPWTPGSWFETSEFVRQAYFVIEGNEPSSGGTGLIGRWVVLTSTHLLFYKCQPSCKQQFPASENDNTGCKYPNNGVPIWWLDIGTVEASAISSSPEESLAAPEQVDSECTHKSQVLITKRYCMTVTGLAGESQEKVLIHFCKGKQTDLEAFAEALERQFLDAHGIKGDAISHKVSNAVQNIEDIRKPLQEKGQFAYSGSITEALVPDAMAPLLCMSELAVRNVAAMKDTSKSQHLATAADVAHLEARDKFTRGQAVPFRPGKNSRSKAKFFFSPDKSMIIKMIREEEYKALWDTVTDCSYSQRMRDNGPGRSSLLNPILLAFLDAGQYWIIMRNEEVPQMVADKLPPKGSTWRKDFFKDIKPGNMVSDRKEFAKMIMNERMLTGLQMTPALDEIMDHLMIDVQFLESKRLIDYSMLVFGSFIELDHDDEDSRDFFSPTIGARQDKDFPVSSSGTLSSSHRSILTGPSPKQWLQKVVKLAPRCGMACSDRPRKLVDVTNVLQKDSGAHYTWSSKSYKCCCIELKPGDSALVRAPCALVQHTSISDCGGLLGSRFHAFRRASVGGKCLIDWDQWEETAGLKFLSGRTVYAQDPSNVMESSDPRPLQQMKIVSRVESCVVVCVSVADYLLQSGFGKQAENIALIPVYRGRKWSDYDTRTARLLRCLIGGQPPVNKREVDKKRPGVLNLFLPEKPPAPLMPNEMMWNDCTEDFPEIRVVDDMNVVAELVQIRL